MNNNIKEKFMNKFKKIGVSALAGSLAMVSANAVEYAVTGDAMIKLVTAEGNEAGANSSNGKGYGVDNDIYFNASGELDNGWTVSAYAALNLDGTVTNSSAQLTIGMGSLGTVQFNDVWGVPSYIDDMSSSIHAYEEPWDSTSHGRVTDAFGLDTQSGSVSYLTPSFDFGGASISATATYDPNSGSGAVTPGSTGTNKHSGNTYTVKAVVGGLTVGAGIETSEAAINAGSGEENVTGYAVFDTAQSPCAKLIPQVSPS
jgi:outer membrane protein OmpU